MTSPRTGWLGLRTNLERRAAWWRATFLRLFAVRGALLVLGALLAAVVGASRLVQHQAFGACGTPPFSFLAFELTFDAKALRTLLDAALRAGPGCREGVLRSLVMSDVLFPVAYGLALTGLFTWVERARGHSQGNAGGALRSVVTLLPLAAGILDVFAENVPLYLASRLMPGGDIPGSLQVLVVLGSTGAALKFTALGGFAVGLLLTVWRGPSPGPP